MTRTQTLWGRFGIDPGGQQPISYKVCPKQQSAFFLCFSFWISANYPGGHLLCAAHRSEYTSQRAQSLSRSPGARGFSSSRSGGPIRLVFRVSPFFKFLVFIATVGCNLAWKMGGTKSTPCVLLLLVILLVVLAGEASGLGFECKGEGKACQALVGFKTQQRTNLSAISSLFQLRNHRALLGANGWEPRLPASTTLPKGYILRVPIACGCRNGRGFSRGKPSYTVRKDNTLSGIAADIFAGLLTYQDIAAANNISDPDKIFPDQRLRIPLPCSCDGTAGNGSSVVHFAYIVQAGNTLRGIAASFGAREVDLQTVNGIVNASALQAGQVIDVPLKACSSTASKHWSDGKLLIANGSYAITASHCVLCSCGPRDLDLYCAPAPVTTSCPSMQCENSNLTIGNFTTEKTAAGCNVTTCSYSGYNGDKILTSLSSSVQHGCPAKHALPIFTRPSSTLPPPPPAISSPESSPSPGSVGTNGTAPASGLSVQKSGAAGLFRCLCLPIVLILGLPSLTHFGDR